MEGMALSGLILLRKQPGLTSFDSLKAVKRGLGTGKAGHTGTLDKFAEGLLLVLTGRALKLSQWFTHCDKQYEGTIRFGIETDTLDPEGAEIARAPAPSRDEVEGALDLFRGKIEAGSPGVLGHSCQRGASFGIGASGGCPRNEKASGGNPSAGASVVGSALCRDFRALFWGDVYPVACPGYCPSRREPGASCRASAHSGCRFQA